MWKTYFCVSLPGWKVYICKANWAAGAREENAGNNMYNRPTCLQIHASVLYILRYSIYRTASFELRTALAFVIVSLSIASCLSLVSQNSFHFIFFYILTYCLSTTRNISSSCKSIDGSHMVCLCRYKTTKIYECLKNAMTENKRYWLCFYMTLSTCSAQIRSPLNLYDNNTHKHRSHQDE